MIANNVNLGWDAVLGMSKKKKQKIEKEGIFFTEPMVQQLKENCLSIIKGNGHRNIFIDRMAV